MVRAPDCRARNGAKHRVQFVTDEEVLQVLALLSQASEQAQREL
jgi:hypothetical protein